MLVLVRDESLETENRVLDIAFDISLARDVFISPRVIARAVIEDPVWNITPFLQAIEREGIPLRVFVEDCGQLLERLIAEDRDAGGAP